MTKIKLKTNIKILLIPVLFFVVINISVFAYYKNNNIVAEKKESNAVSEKLAVKIAGTDDNKTGNASSMEAVAIDNVGSSSGETDVNKKSNDPEVAKWIENLIGYKKTEARTLNVPAEYEKIQGAINEANRGDIVRVAEGEYKESVIMKNGVSLEGAGAEMTTIDGNNLGNTVTFKSVRDPKTYLAGFTIKNAGKSLSGVSIENSSPWIHDNIVDENEFGIYIKGESRPVIQKNIIKNSSKGIQVYNFIEEKKSEDIVAVKSGKDELPEESVTKPIIIDNLIIDNKIGIDLSNSYAYIGHNAISYNNHYKTYLGSTYGININSSSSDILSNIITDNGICELCAGVIADEKSKKVFVSHNDIWNNNNDFLCFGECVLEENNISENPLYVDTMLGDYKLQAESALIGKAKDGLDIGIRW